MIEDMTIRKFVPQTQGGYIRAVTSFSAFLYLAASPNKARFEDLRRYQLHLVAGGSGTPTIILWPRTAVSLHRDAAKAASRHPLAIHLRTAEIADRARSGGDSPPVVCGTEPHVQASAERRLWCGNTRI
jgi:hypothetical protein